MNPKDLKEYLLKEENHAFKGWDFSYLDGRWENEDLPWDYKKIVLEYLKDEMNLLDMGTGGGEFLLTLKHPYNKTSITEGYEPNYFLCKEILEPLGIKVYKVINDNLDDIDDDAFDIIINRHESYNEKEIRRVLKNNGLFITQQVGAYNNKDLATFFNENHIDQFPDQTMIKSVNRLKKEGFNIIYKDECFPIVKFFDLGAIAFFAKVITWEFANFSVDANFDKFLILDEIIKEKGYIKSTEHRYVIVAKNNK